MTGCTTPSRLPSALKIRNIFAFTDGKRWDIAKASPTNLSSLLQSGEIPHKSLDQGFCGIAADTSFGSIYAYLEAIQERARKSWSKLLLLESPYSKAVSSSCRSVAKRR